MPEETRYKNILRGQQEHLKRQQESFAKSDPHVIEKLTPAEKRWFSGLTPNDVDELAEGGIRVEGGKVYVENLAKADRYFEDVIISNDPRYGPKPADWIKTPPSFYSRTFLNKAVPVLKRAAGTIGKGILGGVAGLGAEILMPVDLGAADIEDPRYMSRDDPRRIRAERDVAGAEFLAEQPGFGTTAPWAGQEPRPRDPSAYENQETGMETQDFNLPRDIADQLAPPVTEYPEEEQLMAAAEDLDATKEEAFASMAPIGDFSKGALNSLVDALNKALPLFGAPEDYATFAEDIEGALPTEFVRYLAMTSQAANDANLGRLAVDLENIGTDSDLMKAAGQLDVLAENDSFRTFMASADKDTAPPVAEEVVEEEVQVQTPISDTEVEAMFVERAR